MLLQRYYPYIFYFFCTVLSLGAQPWPVMGQVIVGCEPANLLSATVDADVTFDSSSGLYTYAYRVSNAITSLQEIDYFALEFHGEIIDASVTSPRGWTFGTHLDRPIVSWGATEIGPLPPDFVDDGNVVPSPFQIKPGQTLSGFSFRSPNPPGPAQFFAQGFTKLPQVVGDAGELDCEILDFTENSFTGFTSAPTPITGESFPGGRRPGVDGFLVFLNITDDDTLTAPVAIVIKFSLNGETVDRSTFRATLNGVDVTNAFVAGGRQGDLTAVFDLGSSPLQLGRNVLITTVDGIVPDSGRTASDVDRLTFFVQ